MRDVEPYSRLASGYDVVMEYVDYEGWAEYVHELLEDHAPGTRTVLELGCGTGTLATLLQPLGPYEYLATDVSDAMLEVARAKAGFERSDVAFQAADFRTFRVPRPVDVVVLLYDGINYVVDTDGVAEVFRHVREALKPGGVFVFDLSTPANSLNNAALFEDEGEADDFVFSRRSEYDPDTRLHVTTIEMTIEGEPFRERHTERAYDVDEIRPLVEEAGLEILAVYDGFGREPAHSESERVHWIVRRPGA